MIKFECNNHDIKRATFAGSPADITAEILIQATLVYGSIYKTNDKEAAEEFKDNFIAIVGDERMQKVVFDHKMVDLLLSDDRYEKEISRFGDRKEFKKQLMELLSDLGEDDEDEDE